MVIIYVGLEIHVNFIKFSQVFTERMRLDKHVYDRRTSSVSRD
jgi:hypothetical protein